MFEWLFNKKVGFRQQSGIVGSFLSITQLLISACQSLLKSSSQFWKGKDKWSYPYCHCFLKINSNKIIVQMRCKALALVGNVKTKQSVRLCLFSFIQSCTTEMFITFVTCICFYYLSIQTQTLTCFFQPNKKLF